jgi:hypothetical protein
MVAVSERQIVVSVVGVSSHGGNAGLFRWKTKRVLIVEACIDNGALELQLTSMSRGSVAVDALCD